MKGRCKIALKLIMKRHWGTINITFEEIAKESFLAVSTVKQLARVYRKEQESYD